MTSNGERDFPLPFMRRCLRLFLAEPKKEQLTGIVRAHFQYDETAPISQKIDDIIEKFLKRRKGGELATDQLLNVIHMILGENTPEDQLDQLIDRLLTYLTETGNQ